MTGKPLTATTISPAAEDELDDERDHQHADRQPAVALATQSLAVTASSRSANFARAPPRGGSGTCSLGTPSAGGS